MKQNQNTYLPIKFKYILPSQKTNLIGFHVLHILNVT